MDIEQIRTVQPLPPLPARVYFVCKNLGRWADVLRGDDQIPDALDADPDRVVTHEDMTIVQTYVNLRRAGLGVRLVERAKTLLIRLKNLSEEEAYNFLRKQAMEKRVTIGAVAAAVIDSHELLS